MAAMALSCHDFQNPYSSQHFSVNYFQKCTTNITYVIFLYTLWLIFQNSRPKKSTAYTDYLLTSYEITCAYNVAAYQLPILR